MPEFGKQLKELTKESNINLRELFESTDTPYQYLSLWIKDDRRGRTPYYSEVAVWAEIIGVPVEVLIFGDEKKSIRINRKHYDRLIQENEDYIYMDKQKYRNLRKYMKRALREMREYE